MRRAVPMWSVTVVVVAVSGCFAVTDTRTPDGETSGWRLDCAFQNTSIEWPQACVVQASTSAASKAEIWVAVNPTDNHNVVLGAKDNNPELSRNCTWNRLAVSHDAGRTWAESSIGGRLADRGPTNPYYPWACNTDPMFAFSSDGVLHYVMELYAVGTGPNTLGKGSPTNFANGGVAFYLVESRDGGDTWGEPRELLTSPGLAAAPDHPWLVVNPKTGTIHVALLDYLVGHRCYVINVRGDADPELVILPTPDLRGCTQAAVTGDGTLVVGGHEPATASGDTVIGGGRDVWFAHSMDDGRTFTGPVVAFQYTPLAGSFPQADHEANSIMRLVGDANGAARVFVVYDGLEGQDGQVWFRISEDHGMTWSPPTDMARDATRHHQFLPGLAVSDDGVLHAFFMDKRYDPENRLIGITYARSNDSGATWSNDPVTDISWDGDLSRHQYGHAWIGDYLGVSAVGDDVWAGFPDASRGTDSVIAAAHVRRT